MKLYISGTPLEVANLNAGDGVNIKDNAINIDTPIRGIFTQNEYDSMQESQKQSGVYFVDDGGTDTYSVSNIYSANESVVGRWIDGKPIYRYVLTDTAVNGKKINIAHLNIDTCVDYTFVTQTATDSVGKVTKVTSPYTFGNTSFYAYLLLDAVSITVGGTLVNSPFVGVILYTKTTDTVTIDV